MKEIYGQYSREYKVADLHVHTDMTDGTLTPSETVDLAHHTSLDTIAITDHDTIRPGEIAKDYSEMKNLPLEVIIGEEVTSQDGHILGLFLKESIPKGMSAERTIYEIHRQNGLAIIPHPNYKRVRSLSTERIIEIVKRNDPEITIDGIEIFNAGIFLLSERRKAKGLTPSKANEESLTLFENHTAILGAAIGGSDNHRITLGNALTGYKESLEKELREGKTIVLALEFEEMVDNYEESKTFFGNSILQKQRSRHKF